MPQDLGLMLCKNPVPLPSQETTFGEEVVHLRKQAEAIAHSDSHQVFLTCAQVTIMAWNFHKLYPSRDLKAPLTTIRESLSHSLITQILVYRPTMISVLDQTVSNCIWHLKGETNGYKAAHLWLSLELLAMVSF